MPAPLSLSPSLASSASSLPSGPRRNPARAATMTPLVRGVALRLIRRMPPSSHVHFDDLYAIGLLALVEAERRYDPARGVAFGAFAQRRILGAMLDELRHLDTVSRRRRHAIRTGLETENALPCPRLVELSAAVAVADPGVGAEDTIERRQLLARLAAAERRLPERLRLVLHLRMRADWSLRQIADHLGVTQGRVCQLVTKSVNHLRLDLAT